MSTGMGDETPLKREETDSFRLEFIEVVDVPGDRRRVVVEPMLCPPELSDTDKSSLRSRS